MKDLLMILAHSAPREFLITMLEKALKDYKENPTEEAYTMLSTSALVLASKKAIDVSGLDKSLELMDRMTKGADMLNPDKFKS